MKVNMDLLKIALKGLSQRRALRFEDWRRYIIRHSEASTIEAANVIYACARQKWAEKTGKAKSRAPYVITNLGKASLEEWQNNADNSLDSD